MGKAIAVTGMFHSCPKVEPGPVPHVGGPVVASQSFVKVNGLPVVCMGDKAVCVGPPDKVTAGSDLVKISGKKIARMGDGTVHGGKIVAGIPFVKLS